ncbi:DUF6233 domain-containing protein [Streptomyces sp. NPDC057582]|uniref:DUF6233 domain-containing protein n=1 Tax=Streptomyces sp. NPDC057582 TaxID=3346174 RepID=UPI0036A9DA54
MGSARSGSESCFRAAHHRGDCFAAGKRLRAISRKQALAALAGGAPACEVCRPDTALGAL